MLLPSTPVFPQGMHSLQTNMLFKTRVYLSVCWLACLRLCFIFRHVQAEHMLFEGRPERPYKLIIS
jgi:hypothetical protein